MESGIINLVGFSCTGGILLVWARETFSRNVDEEEEKIGILTRIYNFVNDLFYSLLPVAEELEEEEEEQAWKKYVRHQEPGPGRYKVDI